MKRVSNEKISKELDKALYKKAVGYETDEIVEEYVCDEGGDFKLNKKKVTKKYISPDLQSVKMLLDKLNSTKTNKFKDLTDEEIEMVFKGMPTMETKEDTIINIMTNNDIAASKREAREFLSNNAITLDGEIINDENYIITNNKKNHIIRRGKKKYYLIKIN